MFQCGLIYLFICFCANFSVEGKATPDEIDMLWVSELLFLLMVYSLPVHWQSQLNCLSANILASNGISCLNVGALI